MKKLVLDTLNEIFNEKIVDDQAKWEYLKYNIKNYTINFFNKLARKKTKKKSLTQKQNSSIFKKNYVDNIDYKACNQQLDSIYKKKEKKKHENQK